MILFALLVVAAASQVTVVDEVLRLPPGGVKLVNLSLRQRPAVVEVSFEVMEGPSGVTVALMGRGDGERSRRGQPHQYLRLLPDVKSGAFRYPARTPGEYQVLIDNRGNERSAAAVKLRVTLAFAEAGTAQPATLPPKHRAAVIVLSLLWFAAVVLWSGKKLLAATEKRKRDEQLPLF